jgi:hypothetical protein
VEKLLLVREMMREMAGKEHERKGPSFGIVRRSLVKESFGDCPCSFGAMSNYWLNPRW